MLRYVPPALSRPTRPYTSFRRRKEHEIVPEQLIPEERKTVRDNKFIRKNIKNVVMQSASMHIISKRSLSKKALVNSQSVVPAYLEKEAKERQLTTLKNLNNDLVKENYKLKSQIRCLDNQIRQLQDTAKVKRTHGHPTQRSKQLSRGLIDKLKKDSHHWKKQFEQTKGDLQRLKRDVKCTAVQQLQAERHFNLQQLKRLRQLVDAGLAENSRLKMEEKQIAQTKKDLRKMQNTNRELRLQNAVKRRTEDRMQEKRLFQPNNHPNSVNLQLKNIQIKRLRTQLKQAYNLLEGRKQQSGKQTLNKPTKNMSNSKVLNIPTSPTCKQCQQLKIATKQLYKQIEMLTEKLQNIESGGRLNGLLINPPSELQRSEVVRFLTLRFKAHRLPLEQASLYLLDNQNLNNLQDHMSMCNLIELLMGDPFELIKDKYLQTFIYTLCHQQQGPLKVKIEKQFAKAHLRDYVIDDQSQEKQILIEQRQFLTNNPQIFAQLKQLQSEDNLISERDLRTFFTKNGQDQRHIDFMLTHIILEAVDLQQLSLLRLFEIFYRQREGDKGGNGNAIEMVEKESQKMTDKIENMIAAGEDRSLITPFTEGAIVESVLPQAAVMTSNEISRIYEDSPEQILELLPLQLFNIQADLARQRQ